MGPVKQCMRSDECGTALSFAGFSAVQFVCDELPELATVDTESAALEEEETPAGGEPTGTIAATAASEVGYTYTGTVYATPSSVPTT